MAAMPADAFDLEAMRKEDQSWHPCRVSPRSNDTSFGIIVDFKDGTEENIISDRGEVLARLRHRSTPLQGGECFHIKEGEHVLVMHKDRSRSLFFDAVIEKVYRVRHSSRVYCRCTFEIKCLNPELGGETKIVSSNSIMRLSNKGIDSHPVLASFLNMLNPTSGMEVPFALPLFEEPNCKDDIHELLDKQVEEIAKLADESSVGSRDIYLEIKGETAGFSEHAQDEAISSNVNSVSSQTTSRVLRSTNELHTEMELKREFMDNPFISPLAARAALASLLQELPQLPEFSISQEFPVDCTPEDTKKHINVQPSDANHILTRYDVSMQDKMSVVSNLNQDTKGGMLGKARDCYKSSITNRKDARKKSEAKKSFKLLMVEEKAVPSTNSGDGTINGQIIPRRLTRSAFQKEEKLTNDMNQQLSNKKLNNHVNTRSRRSLRRAEESSSSVKQGTEENSLTENAPDVSVYNPVTPEKDEKSTKKSISSSVRTDMDSAPERKKRTRSSTIDKKEDQDTKGGMLGKARDSYKSSITNRKDARKKSEAKKSFKLLMVEEKAVPSTNSGDGTINGQIIPRRLTRSAFQKEEKLTTDMDQQLSNKKLNNHVNTRSRRSLRRAEESSSSVKQGTEESSLTENAPDVSVYNPVTPEKDEKSTKKLISSSVHTGMDSAPERKKRTRSSTIDKKEDQGEVLQEKSSQAKKKVSTSKPALRFSGRLKFLPRTRSQLKS